MQQEALLKQNDIVKKMKKEKNKKNRFLPSHEPGQSSFRSKRDTSSTRVKVNVNLNTLTDSRDEMINEAMNASMPDRLAVGNSPNGLSIRISDQLVTKLKSSLKLPSQHSHSLGITNIIVRGKDKPSV